MPQQRYDDLSSEEKNRLVATRVMGWTPHPCEAGDWVEDDSSWECRRCGYSGSWYASSKLTEHEALPPRYSESFDVAWALVQHMVEHHLTSHPSGCDDFWVRFTRMMNHPHLGTNSNIYRWLASWTPDRVCRAALFAYGVLTRDGMLVMEEEKNEEKTKKKKEDHESDKSPV